MTAGKTTDLTRWTFIGKVMSLLFNMLSKVLAPWKKSYAILDWEEKGTTENKIVGCHHRLDGHEFE